MKRRCRSEADCGLFPAGYHRGRLGRPLSFVKFEVPQRQQLASEGTPLTLFAPAPSTVSCVPRSKVSRH